MHAEQIPKLSIVTPSFRQAQFIGRTIDSILDQCHPHLEYIVQDGNGGDGTVEVLQGYGDRITAWESIPDKGQSDALNKAFSRTTGEIMAYLNSDDLLLPGSLSLITRFFLENPDVDAVYGHRLVIDENDMEIGRWIMPAHDPHVMRYADYIPQETLFWRRTAWDRAGSCIDADFRFAMDWDLIMRLQRARAKIVRLPFFLGAFRVHAKQKTSSIITEIGAQEMDRIRKRELGYLPDYQEINRVVKPYLAKATIQHHLYHLAHGR